MCVCACVYLLRGLNNPRAILQSLLPLAKNAAELVRESE